MTGKADSPGRRFTFELEIEINPMLGLPDGEMASLILDGIFELDDRGVLFPGVTVPHAGERLFAVSLKSIGSTRSAVPKPTFRPVAAASSEMTSDDAKMLSDLENTEHGLSDVMAQQRMLRAKLMALEELYRTGGPLTDEDRAAAQCALAAYKALVRHHRRSTIRAL